jgi:Ca2+-binding RTX toxin-like protein
VTRVGTDRITDWTAGVDYLRVLANGTAVIEGLGSANGAGGAYVVDTIGNEAERIDISGGRVNNEGKIVARGLGGIDTLIGSSGDDWLYGNASTNFYFLSEGGNDRVYVDQFDGSRSRHFVEGFTTSGGAASNIDLVMLNKKIIDAFYLGGAGRTAWKLDVDANYTQGQAKSAGVNYLYNNFYSGSYASNNATHNNADGGGFWEGGGGADGTSSLIGLGMAIAGRGMFAIPFVGPIIGAAMIGASIPIEGLGFDPSPTREHRNATYDGVVNAYLNVIADSYGGNGVSLNTTLGVDNSSIRFLDFFQNANVGDGYLPVVEFTAHSGQGIYGYFALHSDDETFVYLVASSDNMVENAEAIFVAEINGRLSASDFGIYNGEEDVYNYGIVPTVVIRTPTVTKVADSATPTADEAQTDGILADVTNPIVISGSVSGALATGSYFRVYDGPTKIYDGDSPVAVPQVTHSLIGTNFTFTDSRALGTTVENTTNTGTNDTFVLSDAYVRYTVELVDGETGIPTRASVRDIKVSGGNAIIDGGGGSDILLVTETSTFLNNISDVRLIGMETIVLAGAVTIVGGVQTPTPINLSLANQSEGFEVISGDAGDTIVGSSGNDTIFGVGGADSIVAGIGADVVVYSTSYQVVTTLVGEVETNTTTDTIVATASQNLAADLTVDGGDGVDTLRFDTDRYDGSTLMFSAPVALTDAQFAKVIRFENLVLNGTGTQAVTLAANANTAFANGITVTTAPTATSLNFDASNANWTRTTHVTGTNNADTMTGGSGNDTLIGGSGNDTITAGTGNDNLSGGDDADTFVLASNLTSADTISGGDGGNNSDTLTFTDDNGAADDLNNVTGIETVTLGNTSTNVVVTTIDALVASGATLTVSGLSLTSGTMTWNGAGETDGKFSITGGGAADTIIGGSGNDTIIGGAGADSITAGTGNDSLSGGDDADTFILGSNLTSADTIVGGDGGTNTDTLTFTDANAAANDLDNVTGIETVRLGNATTVVTTVNALVAIGATLTVDGTALTAATFTWNGEAETDGKFNITGGNADDVITGGSGADTILGGTGADTITGGAGADSLSGGDGNDTFRFDSGDELALDVSVIGGNNTDTIEITSADLTIIDADFANVSTVEVLALTYWSHFSN